MPGNGDGRRRAATAEMGLVNQRFRMLLRLTGRAMPTISLLRVDLDDRKDL